MKSFNGVKVFAATMREQREQLGETVTQWITDHPTYKISEITVQQSSDSAFHCISICVWYTDPVQAKRKVG